MTLSDSEAIFEITRRIVERFHPQHVVLFGSRARGDAGPDDVYHLAEGLLR